MGHRSLALSCALVFPCIAGGSCARGGAHRSLVPGDVLPVEWLSTQRSEPELTVVWAFRTDDCLTCQTMDYSLRRLQAAYPTRVPLIAVHVGEEADGGVPRAFFANRRLHVARAVTVAPGAFHDRFPGAVLPAIYLVRNRRIAWSSTDSPTPGRGTVELDTLAQEMLSGGRQLDRARTSADLAGERENQRNPR